MIHWVLPKHRFTVDSIEWWLWKTTSTSSSTPSEPFPTVAISIQIFHNLSHTTLGWWKKNFGFPTRVVAVAVAVAVVAVETVGLGGVVAAVRVGVVVGLKINEELGKNSATSKCVFS